MRFGSAMSPDWIEPRVERSIRSAEGGVDAALPTDAARQNA